MLGLSRRNTVSQYLRIYEEMPRPVVDLGPSRPRLWLRPEIEAWVRLRQPVRRGRPRKSPVATAATPKKVSSGDKAPPSGGLRQRGGREPKTT